MADFIFANSDSLLLYSLLDRKGILLIFRSGECSVFEIGLSDATLKREVFSVQKANFIPTPLVLVQCIFASAMTSYYINAISVMAYYSAIAAVLRVYACVRLYVCVCIRCVHERVCVCAAQLSASP